MTLICHFISEEHMIKGSYDLMAKSPSKNAIISRDMMVLMCHVILQDHVIKDHATQWVGAPHSKSPTCQVGKHSYKYINIIANLVSHIRRISVIICPATYTIIIFPKAHCLSCSHTRNFRLRVHF